MDTTTNLSTESLMRWENAVAWSRITLQQKIAEMDKWKIDCAYDRLNMERLDELQSFLSLLIQRKLYVFSDVAEVREEAGADV